MQTKCILRTKASEGRSYICHKIKANRIQSQPFEGINNNRKPQDLSAHLLGFKKNVCHRIQPTSGDMENKTQTLLLPINEVSNKTIIVWHSYYRLGTTLKPQAQKMTRHCCKAEARKTQKHHYIPLHIPKKTKQTKQKKQNKQLHALWLMIRPKVQTNKTCAMESKPSASPCQLPSFRPQQRCRWRSFGGIKTFHLKVSQTLATYFILAYF